VNKTSYMQACSSFLGVLFLAAIIAGTAATTPQSLDGQAGYLRIESKPPGALVIIDGMLIGMTPVTYPVNPSETAPLTITVSANGYHSYTVS